MRPRRPRALLFVAAVALVGLAGCLDASCQNTIVSDITAPGSRLRAVMFDRSCGATTDSSTQVALLIPGQKPEGGNIFVADADHGAAARGGWGGPWARLRWDGPHKLNIDYARHTRVFMARRQFMSVHTDFTEVDAPPGP